MKCRLKNTLKPERYLHTLGVAYTAKKYAAKAGVDADCAETAALLHDCAKSMNYEAMLALAEDAGVYVDDIEKQIPSIVHAPAGKALAMRDYGITDEGILSAIRLHTIGGRRLSALEMLIYLSDFIEPERKPFDGLDQVRALAERNLYAASRMAARLSADYVMSRGGLVHPATIEMFQYTEE